MKDLLIYGAYGYTGKIIVDEALAKGLKPTLAGRSEEKTKALAEKKGLEYKAFSLDDTVTLDNCLKDHKIVIHCAGPFIHTAKIMADACLRTKTHYLDITGEYQIFELMKTYNEKAEKEYIMIMPGAGFDVVPSDCLAAHLKSKLPEATSLLMAFTGLGGGLSRGTAKTMIENAHEGQLYRKDGILVSKPAGSSTKKVNYGEFEQPSVGISWGDISTAYHSTGIPNIEVLMGSTDGQIKKMKKMNSFKWLLKMRFVKNFLQKQIDKKPAGPSDDKREKGRMFLWGEATSEDQKVEARLTTPNGYTLTANTSVLIAQKILNGNYKKGFQTPASAYGKDLILEVPDTKIF